MISKKHYIKQLEINYGHLLPSQGVYGIESFGSRKIQNSKLDIFLIDERDANNGTNYGFVTPKFDIVGKVARVNFHITETILQSDKYFGSIYDYLGELIKLKKLDFKIIPESKIQKEVMDYLKNISYVTKVTPYGNNGIMDIIGCYKGLFFAVELKKADNVPTPLQKRNIKSVIDNGGMSIVAYSLREVEDMINILDEKVNTVEYFCDS